MSDTQIIFACILWYIAGVTTGWLKQQLKIEKLRKRIADLEYTDRIIKVLNA